MVTSGGIASEQIAREPKITQYVKRYRSSRKGGTLQHPTVGQNTSHVADLKQFLAGLGIRFSPGPPNLPASKSSNPKIGGCF